MNKILVACLAIVALTICVHSKTVQGHPSLTATSEVKSNEGDDDGVSPQCYHCCCGYCISCKEAGSPYLNSTGMGAVDFSGVENVAMVPESQVKVGDEKTSCCCCGWCLTC